MAEPQKERNYWCYRIDKFLIDFFFKELEGGKLRQGWGWDERQDLRKLQMDEGAYRNLPMYNKVKKGDILLVPYLPEWGKVAIVEATEDWDKGYRFEIAKEHNDFGHIFPAEYKERYFTRNNEYVSANLRSTLRTPSRFWNINRYAEDVDALFNVGKEKLLDKEDYQSRFSSVVGQSFEDAFDKGKFAENLYNGFKGRFQAAEWEFALVEGLSALLPAYQVERVGGKTEKEHGTDILIKLPGITGEQEYAIAIQVKDYGGEVKDDVIHQINNAENYNWENGSLKLIDKWVIITNAKEEDNKTLLTLARDKGVKLLFAGGLKKILEKIGTEVIGINLEQSDH